MIALGLPVPPSPTCPVQVHGAQEQWEGHQVRYCDNLYFMFKIFRYNHLLKYFSSVTRAASAWRAKHTSARTLPDPFGPLTINQVVALILVLMLMMWMIIVDHQPGGHWWWCWYWCWCSNILNIYYVLDADRVEHASLVKMNSSTKVDPPMEIYSSLLIIAMMLTMLVSSKSLQSLWPCWSCQNKWLLLLRSSSNTASVA